jgi:hypothetical protein
MADNPQVSFVIPAKNEAAILPETLESIKHTIGDAFRYEIILIDNGSIDSTSDIALTMGATVIDLPTGSLGALRNTGASRASAEILVFLDADVVLESAWLSPFIELMGKLADSPMMISGSRCQIPSAAGWLPQAWFWTADTVSASHIGTGHMVTTRSLMQAVGGFDETLATGEDFDFCMRAKDLGADIFRDQRLKVFHYGYPKNISQFFRREVWHGSGDAGSLERILASKVALTAVIFVALNVAALLSLWTCGAQSAVFWLAIAGIAGVCVGSSIVKYRNAPIGTKVQNVAIFYLYYWARAASIARGILGLGTSSSPRTSVR